MESKGNESHETPAANGTPDDVLRCDHCGSALNPQFLPRECPHCNTPVPAALRERVAAAAPAPGDAVDEQGCIIGDTECIHCDYNLRGLLANGRCPECGNAVSASLRADLLQFNLPGYVQALAEGVKWVWIGALVQIGVVLLSLVSLVVFMALGNTTPAWFDMVSGGLIAALGLGLLGGTILLVVGAWHVTTPDPTPHSEGSANIARKVVRWYIPAAIVGFGAGVLCKLVDPPFDTLLLMTEFAINGFGVLAIGGYFAYLSSIVRRIPSGRLAGSANALSGLMLVTLGGFWFLSVVEGESTPGVFTPTPLSSPVAPCVVGGLSLAWLGGILWAVDLHGRLRKPLRQAAEVARQRYRATARKGESV